MEVNRTSYVDERPREVLVTETPVAGQPVVAATPVYAPVAAETTHYTSRTNVAPYAWVAGIVAVGLLVLGGITTARAGLDGALDEPVVSVAGFTATALLGLIELAAGVLLLIAALSRSRAGTMFFGIVFGVASLVAVFEPTVGNGSLAMERGLAVLFAIAFGVVVAVAALLPDVRRTVDHVERI